MSAALAAAGPRAESSATRILLADDSADVRAAFRVTLGQQPDMTVVGEAIDGEEALVLARRLRPDVVIADIRMPRVDGLLLTRQLAGPGVADPTRVIVVTTFDLDEYVDTALRAGACGFILKRSNPALLIEAIRSAMAGDALISPEITMRLLRKIQRAPIADLSAELLTERELEIAVLVARGFSNADIGGELFISPGTVKNHVANAARKLDVRNRVGIAAWVWANDAAGIGGPRE